MSKNGKRRIQLWQMIVMVVFPLVVFISSFFVRIRIDATAISDAYAELISAVSESAGSMLSRFDGLAGLGGLGGNVADEFREEVEDEIKHDFTLTGWEVITLTDNMIMEKVIHMSGEDEGADEEEIEKAVQEIRENEEASKVLSEINSFFGYMRVGYACLYIACPVLIVLVVLWFIFGRDALPVVIANLAVSVGGVVVAALGTLNIGANGAGMIKSAVEASGKLGPYAAMFLDAVDFTKPLRLFGIAVNMTFGGVGCLVVCAVMLLFAAYMMIDCMVFAKRRAVYPSQAMSGYADPGTAYEPNSSASFGYAAASSAITGRITVTRGEFAGASLEVHEGEEIILGRDPAVCHLVFSDNKISRKHCGIRFDPQSNRYLVKNYSMNGTVFASGQSVSSDVFVEVVPGNVVELANGREEIVLG